MVREIDVMHLGRDRVIAAHEIGGFIVDPGPESSIHTLLDALGDEEPRGLLLTHIHLDHAGATGALVRRFPELPVYVHERGAPHLVDPSKLLKSAGQLYGDEMQKLWGDVFPVPEANIRVLRGGERIEGFRVEYTPGHASHHVSYLHEGSGDAFVGDTGGVLIPPSHYVVTPTPPPDIDLELWQSSVDTIEGWRPETLRLTHFGCTHEIGYQLTQVRERLHRWGELARTVGEEEFISEMEGEILEANETDTDTSIRFFQAVPADQSYLGLKRYWTKREDEAATG